jgi:hypothetical protein
VLIQIMLTNGAEPEWGDGQLLNGEALTNSIKNKQGYS